MVEQAQNILIIAPISGPSAVASFLGSVVTSPPRILTSFCFRNFAFFGHRGGATRPMQCLSGVVPSWLTYRHRNRFERCHARETMDRVDLPVPGHAMILSGARPV
ncbi:hypothetical protein N7510_006578 [Penicillium lagena]|uniref:uncharacterized protein n=1 Tax=Penicillium lagena TaxID=94218 RepID=UPI002541C6DC|nr:uncharacterized protein N7510_006578 [Penicillium lagena]KAJ5613384.1 hypothetical protein N7510_006578 [Penicillium lagena]